MKYFRQFTILIQTAFIHSSQSLAEEQGNMVPLQFSLFLLETNF